MEIMNINNILLFKENYFIKNFNLDGKIITLIDNKKLNKIYDVFLKNGTYYFLDYDVIYHKLKKDNNDIYVNIHDIDEATATLQWILNHELLRYEKNYVKLSNIIDKIKEKTDIDTISMYLPYNTKEIDTIINLIHYNWSEIGIKIENTNIKKLF